MITGLRLQVQRVVDVLSGMAEINNLQIRFNDWNKDPESSQTVLEPFLTLRNLKNEFVLIGDVTDDFAERLREWSPLD